MLTRAQKYEICIFGRSRVREATQICVGREEPRAGSEQPPKVDFDELFIVFCFLIIVKQTTILNAVVAHI